MLVIDIDKCYDCGKCVKSMPGLYTYIERGIRVAVCRHCANAPCVAACPVEALERPINGDLVRYTMKCVSCKQCATACPVGANPAEVLKYVTHPAYKIDSERLKKICSEGAVDDIDTPGEDLIVVDGEFAVKTKDWK